MRVDYQRPKLTAAQAAAIEAADNHRRRIEKLMQPGR